MPIAGTYPLTALANGASQFGPDMFCWEEDFFAKIGVGGIGSFSITNVAEGFGKLEFSVTVSSITVTEGATVLFEAFFHDMIKNVRGGGMWQLTDNVGNVMFLESVPTSAGSESAFTVISREAPMLGMASLEYLCPLAMGCDFCKSRKVRAVLEPAGVIGETGVALEKLYDRVAERLTQVTPAHVDLVLTYRRQLEASLTLVAEIVGSLSSNAVLEAPLTAEFDTIAGDEFVPDTAVLTATVEPL